MIGTASIFEAGIILLSELNAEIIVQYALWKEEPYVQHTTWGNLQVERGSFIHSSCILLPFCLLGWSKQIYIAYLKTIKWQSIYHIYFCNSSYFSLQETLCQHFQKGKKINKNMETWQIIVTEVKEVLSNDSITSVVYEVWKSPDNLWRRSLFSFSFQSSIQTHFES